MRLSFRAAALAAIVMGVQPATAGEGAFSNYFPGAYGSLLPGVAPEPGLAFSSMNLFYSADATRSVLQGRVNLGVEVEAAYSLETFLYTWDAPALGGRFAVGGYLPLGYSNLDATATVAGFPTAVSEDRFDLGDIGIIPASFYWTSGNLSFNLYELVVAPTGQYDSANFVNIGRNYWSFDTNLAVTWFRPETGTEFSTVLGVMVNTENPDTDYKTGTEFHADFMFNQFLSESFALGLHGYYYKQLSGDSGTGAVLGSFKGESYGLGPAISWVPVSKGGKFALSAKYLRDLDATNRLEADYGVVSLSWVF